MSKTHAITTIVPRCVDDLAASVAAKAMHQALFRNRAGNRLICDAESAPAGYQRMVLAADPRHFRLTPESA